LNALGGNARRQYRQFTPNPSDTLSVLTIVSHGCATGTSAGPACESITRAVLLSDIQGDTVVEAIENHAVPQSWQNGYGATAACSGLASKFSMADVQKVRNKKGGFLVATFDGSRRLKVYTVKDKHLKKLGI
jgi:hypothetical protein